jgi:hypothetical protein
VKTEKKYFVEKIGKNLGRALVQKYHYARSCSNASSFYGFFVKFEGIKYLIGCVAFNVPCSEYVRSQFFGNSKEEKDSVFEIGRLLLVNKLKDCLKIKSFDRFGFEVDNTLSYFLSMAIKKFELDRSEIGKNIRLLISFSDTTEGHSGTIYQACNFFYAGSGQSTRFYRDSMGRLRHPRQCGINISEEEASEIGFQSEIRMPKHRYVLFVGDKRKKRQSFEMFQRNQLVRIIEGKKEIFLTRDYPKDESKRKT